MAILHEKGWAVANQAMVKLTGVYVWYLKMLAGLYPRTEAMSPGGLA